MPRIHIVGAGIAGLSAAVRLAGQGREVVLYEAGRHAGGRCRSYFDTELGCRLDNGNHLLLTANRAALDYLGRIGARDTMVGPQAPHFDFCDFADDVRWVLAPGEGRFPWWILDRARRVPGTRMRDYLRLATLARSGEDATVSQRLDTESMLYRRLLEPFAVAALNTESGTASAALLWDLLVESFGSGGKALRPLVPREGLSESLVDPALVTLAQRGATVRFGTRLREIGLAGDRVVALDFDDGVVALDPDDAVILAVTAPVAARLLPGITAPTEFRAIVNAHYRVATDAESPLFIGVIGGTAEWVFRKPGILSVTVSAADRLVDEPADSLAERLWRDVARAYRLGNAPLPPHRIVKEKRATFAATPAQERLRPAAATRWRNLVLAGDWTRTGLPATIEGAVRSGNTAAGIVQAISGNSLTVNGLEVTQSSRLVA
jgi:squalene-associated FAD-dependent desaturase